MKTLDSRLDDAVGELRADVSLIHPPPFEPTSRVALRLAAALLAVAMGIFAVFALLASDSRAIERIVTNDVEGFVEDPAVEDPAVEDPAVEETTEPDAFAVTPEPESDGTPGPSVAGGPQIVGPLSAMSAGQTLAPVDGVGAWNSDQSMMLLYRRGDDGGEFVVKDAATGDDIAVAMISPPDIEQVYWSPTVASVINYADGPNLIAYDVMTGESEAQYTFEGCAEVRGFSGPEPPSEKGDFGFLCVDEGSSPVDMIAFNVVTKKEVRKPTDVLEAPAPSPSGEFYVMWNDDDSASVLDGELAETGVVLELGGNSFVFVVDAEGRESVAAGLYAGEAVGTVVVMPLNGDVPTVVIGPDAGDEYPPPGTRLSSARGSTQLAVAIDGPESSGSALAGRLLAVDLAARADSVVVDLGPHGSAGDIDAWYGRAYISMSPSGQFLMSSSDNGTDAVDTTVLQLRN